MKTSSEIKEFVRDTYSKIAVKNDGSSCCSSDCYTDTYSIMEDEYTDIKGYNPDADLGLGCGLPTIFAEIKKGDTVVDLGSGAGNDCFIAASETGNSGKVIGVDFSEAMIEKANANLEKSGLKNIEFRFGDIENLPVDSDTADVVISNCVLNLVPDKKKVFSEIYRILKSGGHFSISDIVLLGYLPDSIRDAATVYAGCISGALQKDDYLKVIASSGFKDIKIKSEKVINIPDDYFLNYISESDLSEYKKSNGKIISLTISAEK